MIQIRANYRHDHLRQAVQRKPEKSVGSRLRCWDPILCCAMGTELIVANPRGGWITWYPSDDPCIYRSIRTIGLMGQRICP